MRTLCSVASMVISFEWRLLLLSQCVSSMSEAYTSLCNKVMVSPSPFDLRESLVLGENCNSLRNQVHLKSTWISECQYAVSLDVCREVTFKRLLRFLVNFLFAFSSLHSSIITHPFVTVPLLPA